MAKRVQLRRGTTSETSTFTGALGEVTVDTTKKTLVVHDGATAGGFAVAARANTDDTVTLLNKSGNVVGHFTTGTNLVFYAPIPYPQTTPPSGYLMMMGQAISQATYPILYSLYGTNLPDLRGVFVRGWDNGRGLDSNRTILTYQADDLISHLHYMSGYAFGGNGPTGIAGPDGYQGDWFRANSTTYTTGGTETRPKNVAFNYIVKAG